jgi:Domain of unknown function (DUF397)
MELFTHEESIGGSTGEPGEAWRKSSRSYSNGGCVEVARVSRDLIGVRDSKRPGGPVLRFTPVDWGAFLRSVRDGEFDRRE